MRFARYTFEAAGTIGILVLVPLYFLLEQTGIDNPPPITHPEYYYGFVGVALAFQIVFLIVRATRSSTGCLCSPPSLKNSHS